ncbi:MAG: hypothetical protein ACO1RX_09160 [Candidatus Sericytochromatia bacterium]
MTEIRSGADITVSKALLEQIRVKSQDGITQEELTELKTFAEQDAAGLDSNEEKLLNSLDVENTSRKVVDQNIQSFQSLATHETDANEVDFSQLNVVTEESGLLSTVSFGLFGRSKEQNAIRVLNGDIPPTSNPTELTNMSERVTTELNNLDNLLGPLQKELTANTEDVRQKIAAANNIDLNAPDAQAQIDAKRQDLLDKISQFKEKGDSASFGSLKAGLSSLVSEYSRGKTAEGAPISSSYITTLQGTLFNISDSQRMGWNQEDAISSRGEETPANTEAVNASNQALNEGARAEINRFTANGEALISSLKNLRDQDPAAYREAMGNFSDSDLMLLEEQIKSLKTSTSDGSSPITQAQMSQLNLAWASLNRLSEQPLIQNVNGQNMMREDAASRVKAAEESLKVTDLTPEQRQQAEANLAEAQAFLKSIPTTEGSPSQSVVDAFNKTYGSGVEGSVQKAFYQTENAVENASLTLAQIENARTTLESLTSDYSLSASARTQLNTQLQAVVQAETALRAGQPVRFDSPEQQAAFDSVMGSIRATANPPVSNVSDNPGLCLPLPNYSPLLGMDSLMGMNLGYGLGNSSFPSLTSSNLWGYNSSSYIPPFTPSLNTPRLNYSLATDTQSLDLLTSGSLGTINPSITPGTGIGLSTFQLGNSSLPLSMGASTIGNTTFPSVSSTTEAMDAFSAEAFASTTVPQSSPQSLRDALLQGVNGSEVASPSTPGSLDEASQTRWNQLNEIARALPPAPATDPSVHRFLQSAMAEVQNPGSNPQVSASAVDEMLAAYQDIKSQSSAQVAAVAVSDAIGALNTGKSLAEVSQVLQGYRQNAAPLVERQRQIEQQADTALNNAQNQFRSNLETAGGSIEELARMSGYSGTGSRAQHFANLTPAQYAELGIPARIQKLEADLAAARTSGSSAAEGGAAPNVAALQQEINTLKSIALTQQAKVGIEGAIGRLDNQISRISASSKPEDIAAVQALRAQRANLVTMQTKIANGENFTRNEIASSGRALAVHMTGTLIAHLSKSNTSESSPEFQKAYARYQELLANPNGFSAGDMMAVFNELQTAMNRGSSTLVVRQPLPSFDVVYVDDPPTTDPSTGQIVTSSETHAADTVDGNRALVGQDATMLNIGAAVARNADVVDAASVVLNGSVISAAGTTQTLDISALSQPGPLRDEFIREFNRPGSFTKQVYDALAQRGAVPPVLKSIVDGMGQPGESPVGVSATTGGLTSGAELLTALAEQKAFTLSSVGSTRLADPTGPEITGDPAVPSMGEAYVQGIGAILNSADPEAAGNSFVGNVSEGASTVHTAVQDLQKISSQMNINAEQFQQARVESYREMLNQIMMQAALDGGISREEIQRMAQADPEMDQKTMAAINEANNLEATLELAPMPAVNSEDLFSQWLTDTLGIIRGADEKTRQIVLAQLALQMMDQVINTFYKNKNDENSEYHQDRLAALTGNRSQEIQQTQANRDVGSASNSQAVAATSGVSGGAERSSAFNLNALREQNVEGIRDQLRQVIQSVREGSPQLPISAQQETSILDGFDRVLLAGKTPGIADDQAALVGLGDLLQAQALR